MNIYSHIIQEIHKYERKETKEVKINLLGVVLQDQIIGDASIQE